MVGGLLKVKETSLNVTYLNLGISEQDVKGLDEKLCQTDRPLTCNAVSSELPRLRISVVY